MPDHHGLTDGKIEVAAGKTEQHDNVDIACPADGAACSVDYKDGKATYDATGGTPTAAAAWDEMELPTGHGLKSEELKLSAGKMVSSRGVVVSCPDGCETKVDDKGKFTYKATGSEPTIETNYMILVANSGPNYDSDGEHATGLITRIGTSNTTSTGLSTGDAVTAGSIVQSTMEDVPTTTAKASHPHGKERTLELELDGSAFRADSSGPVKVNKRAGFVAPGLDGFNSVALKRTAEGGTTVHAVVYSDIAEAKAAVPPVNKIFRNPDFSNNSVVQTQLSAKKDHVITGMTLPVTGLNNVTVTKERDWDEQVAKGTGSTNGLDVTFDDYDHDDDSSTDPITKGLLQCVEGPCQSSQESTSIAKLLGTWQLVVETKPGEPEKPDTEYLTFGVWLSSPDLPDGRHDVGAFADGAGNALSKEELNTLVGTATYAGPATGIYVKGTYKRPTASQDGRDDDPVVEGSEAGSFVAKANLTANFGTTSTDGSTGNVSVVGVSGQVNRFEENGESLGDWRVTLDSTQEDMFDGDTRGEADGRPLAGKWGVKFFKDGNEKTNDDAKTQRWTRGIPATLLERSALPPSMRTRLWI